MNESNAFYLSPKKGKRKTVEDDEVGGNNDKHDQADAKNGTEMEDVETTYDEWELARGKIAQSEQERAQKATDDSDTNPSARSRIVTWIWMLQQDSSLVSFTVNMKTQDLFFS